MPRPLTAIILVALFTATAASGCFARGDVSFQMQDPRAEAWTPTSLLLAALEAADGDPNATMLLEYGATFGEDGVIRILELRVLTHDRQTGDEFYLDYLVGRDYDPETDAVEFRGFRHDEGDKSDPAKEWDLRPDVLAILDQQSFGAMAANETQRLGDVPIVRQFSLGADCAPVWQQTGDWQIYNATGEGIIDAGVGWDLDCYARARLPPTMLVNLHTPCFKNPQCPQAEVHQFLVNYPEPVA